jgi:hypothetical protein
LQRDEHVSAGEHATFYTNGWIFGDSLAVRSLGHQDIATGRATLSAVAGPDPVQNAADRSLRSHIADADHIVTGTVASTHLASVPVALATSGPITEHDPLWHDAVVQVSAVEKGALAPSPVVVRYPSSTDVRWYRVPKLQPGMTGTFFLHSAHPDAPVSAIAPGALSAAPNAPAFVLLHAEDFHPIEQLPRVRAMISTVAGSPAKA